MGVEFKPLSEVLACDIISLHCPLNDQTKHIINDETIAMMKKGVTLINTSRGALVDTMTVIHALKTGRIGYLGLDVYEQEEMEEDEEEVEEEEEEEEEEEDEEEEEAGNGERRR